MKLIETTYIAGGNKPVALIAHSMGGPTSLYFLTKYVKIRPGRTSTFATTLLCGKERCELYWELCPVQMRESSLPETFGAE